MALTNIPKVYILATINILCTFIHVYDVTDVEIQFNHFKTSQLHKFVKNVQKHHKIL